LEKAAAIDQTGRDRLEDRDQPNNWPRSTGRSRSIKQLAAIDWMIAIDQTTGRDRLKDRDRLFGHLWCIVSSY
jgi:hypothetical protein